MKTSSVLSGEIYTRIKLAERFGITDATIHTGIFRPSGHDSIWLFVTEKKSLDRTQYLDQLNGDELTWAGQTSGRRMRHEEQGLSCLSFIASPRMNLETTDSGTKAESTRSRWLYSCFIRFKQKKKMTRSPCLAETGV